MVKVIVFSKDRPMQLHGYIESLLLYSEIKQNDISVLYYENKEIPYNKVMDSYPYVNWIKEFDFNDQFRELVEKSEDYIMFGCDDVVFTKAFSIEKIIKHLKDRQDVFGVSLRLGNNIKPFPKDRKKTDEFWTWNWRSCHVNHYNYPWELDCTVYRKNDITKMLNQYTEIIKTPNFLEEIFESDTDRYISKDFLSCLHGNSKAFVITVNRVQDTHMNPVDGGNNTDVGWLGKLYNENSYVMNIKKIAWKRNNMIHVGAKYFILKKKEINKFKRIKKNLKFLLNTDLETVTEDYILNNLYDIDSKIKNLKKINIITAEQTIKLLAQSPKSFCRIGDGEIQLMRGNSIPFQKHSPKLEAELKCLIHNNFEKMYIGLPYSYFSDFEDLTPPVKKFHRDQSKRYRDYLLTHVESENLFIDTNMSQMYQTYREYDFKKHFDHILNLFYDKKLVLIARKGILDQYQFNCFEKAKEINYIYGPSKDAYEDISEIIKEVKKYSLDTLVCCILGPASKCLAYRLTNEGYMVWDIGHLLKDYNYYRNNIPRTLDTVTSFYNPD